MRDLGAIWGNDKYSTDKQEPVRLLVSILLLLPALTSYSQDLIILRNGEEVDCEITKVDSAIIHYDFYKGERKLSSFVSKANIRSYKINSADSIPDNSSDVLQVPGNTVIIDTTEYVKETSQWVNLITYSQRYGLNANGWSIQYYGYNLRPASKWTIPMLFGFEGFTIHTDYFSQFDYQSVSMSYFMAGISPFYKLNDYFFQNLGVNIVFGEEELTNFNGTESSNTFLGFAPSQGIYFIPKSKVGMILGLSVYEKLLSAEVYKNDIGVKLEAGIKF